MNQVAGLCKRFILSSSSSNRRLAIRQDNIVSDGGSAGKAPLVDGDVARQRRGDSEGSANAR